MSQPSLPQSALTGLGRWPRLGITMGCGLLAALGNPPIGVVLATFGGLFLILYIAPWTLGPRRAFWAGWGFGFGYFLPTFHWLVEPFLVDPLRHGWMAPFAISFMAGGLALFWGAAFAIGGWRRSGLVTAAAWAGFELLRGHVFTGFPWAMPVTAWVDRLIYQGAAFVGPYGLTLAVLLALLLIIHLESRTKFLSPVLLGLLAMTIMVPAPRGPIAGPEAPLLRAVQPNAAQHEKWDPQHIPKFWERKIAATKAEPAVDLILWPEMSLHPPLNEAETKLAHAAEQSQGTPLLIGAHRFGEKASWFNVLALIGPGGEVSAIHDKAHLVPFGEYMPLMGFFARLGIFGLATDGQFGFSPGAGQTVMTVPGIGPVQPLLCYESVFPHNVGKTPERPVLLALSTNDAWFGEWGGPKQHLQQSQARAIEQGLPVLRSANTGISAVIDARGQILTSLALGETGHVDHALPPALPPTLYSRFREWGLLLLLSLTLCADLIRRRANRD